MEVLLDLPSDNNTNLLPFKSLEKEFKLSEHLDSEAKKFISAAKVQFGGNLKKMAQALGFKNHQTLSARMKKLYSKGS